MTWKLKTPARVMLIGPSQSGKSELILRLVADDSVWDAPFRRIVYVAPLLDDRDAYLERLRETCGEKKTLTATDAIPKVEDLRSLAHEDVEGRGVLLVLDDLLSYKQNPDAVRDLAVMHSHHSDISVVMCVQNPFSAGKSKLDLVTLGRNLTAKFILYQLQDYYVLRTLNSRLFPERKDFLLRCLKTAKEKLGACYVVVNLHPFSGLERRVICYTGVFADERAGRFDSPVFFALE